MGKFDSLRKTLKTKRTLMYDYTKYYRKGRFSKSIDYDYFETENVNRFIKYNINKRKPFDEDLVRLWAILDIKSYIDYDLGNTINLYFLDGSKPAPISTLPDYNYMRDEQRKLNLLDIKFVKKMKINNLEFENLYFATFDIMDSENQFQPYVLIFFINENNEFTNIGYGYDSNNNGSIEIFMNAFNYPIYLQINGMIISPLLNKKIKLNVKDYITDKDISRIIN